MTPTKKLTPVILTAAIAGFEAQKSKIDLQIVELRAMLNGYATPAEKATAIGRPKRKMSAAGRRRIAAAQRARWAKAKQEPAPAPKRRISAAGKKAIIAATKKRWAKYRAAKRAAAARA
jgi:hypothetical protein